MKDTEREDWQKVYEKTMYSESIIEEELTNIDLLSPITLSTFCLHSLAKVKLAEDIDTTRNCITAILNHIYKDNSTIDQNIMIYKELFIIFWQLFTRNLFIIIFQLQQKMPICI